MKNVHRLFLKAVMAGNIANVKRHLQNGANLNVHYGRGNNAIMLIAKMLKIKSGHIEIFKFLLETGIDVNQVNKDGHTVITLSQAHGNHYLVDLIKSFSQKRRLDSVIQTEQENEGDKLSF